MLSWNIFRRALTLIIDNIGAALRVSALPYGVLVVVSLYFVGSADVMSVTTLDPTGGDLPDIPDGFIGALLITSLAQLFAFLWIAVAWHRYVLLEEGGATWVPPFHGDLMLGYFGRSFLLGLMVFGVVIGVSMTLGLVVPAMAIPVSFVLATIVTYRCGMILPAGAVGRSLKIGDAWEATKGQSGTMVLLALLTYALSLLLQVPTMLDGEVGVISTIYGLVVGWFLLLVGVSILTSLYGHLIEGRPVD
ncbi:hypothetical protein [Jannaschia sp. M317]|uniref:hypothetical protein n=1 Tax=Jannaschia sp. M317 TaxID=2867011 RepID=UPI0021A35F97|nr:hypothetical protein [Jannaschia sp. M317]UWQ18121.1 hypothetical protein K3551_02090 [Jannaschia sp. M317]